MRIFLSYASEDQRIAERIALGLRGDGHTVFFADTSLQGGDDYHTIIAAEIARSDLLVFLISKHSIAAGTFTRSELREAELRWRHPKEGVIPVLVDDTRFDAIPPYLAAVTVLRSDGDLVADVVARVARWRRPARRRRMLYPLMAGVLLAVVGAPTTWWLAGRSSAKLWCVVVSPRMDGEHTRCFETEAACLEFRAIAEKSKAHTPLREVGQCRLEVPPK